jgi:hypothetical protein
LYAIDKWQFIGFTAALLVLTFSILYPAVSAILRARRRQKEEHRRRQTHDRYADRPWH